MFNFLRKPAMRRPSAAILRALEAESLPPGTDLAALGVVTSSGRYAGRKVTYFRVFDPTGAAARAADVFASYSYDDLGAHPDLVLREGFLERDGAVVVYTRQHPRAAAPRREEADRAAHADDERFVYPDTESAREQARS